ncbi:E3 ubiquitin-protein ligase RFWD3 [Drosophila hydei]|uniref:RING-type E3 ubiquitin transferase n=1 Tax=Drosophila hydei TaxID=7224 RepID=A0A6J1MSW3_DROHY|nr:E3 ubiquitin-protein ligase RFWD3 [Drosophila hydei]
MSDSDSDTTEQDADSQDFQPVFLRSRRLQRIGQSQNSEPGELEEMAEVVPEEQQEEIEPPAQRRSVDVLPFDDEENDEPEEADQLEAADESDAAEEPEVAEVVEAAEEPEVADEPEAAEEPGTPDNEEENIDQPDVPSVEQEVVPGEEANAEHPSTSRRVEQQESDIINLDSPSPPKKRKRLSNVASKEVGTPVAKPSSNDDVEDDGMTCPICLESWEMSGEHRLVSLRCGHLFGESCIRRWLIESQRQSAIKVCPQCKTKASNRDIRCLYAKRLRAIDRTEEHDMRRELDAERRRTQALTTELATIKMSHSLTINKMNALQLDYERLRQIVRAGGDCRGAYGDALGSGSTLKSINQLASHRLYMEKNFEITREPGCRVLLYSVPQSTLIASQKSAQNLFPGYGVRFIDPPSFKPLHFLHTSALLVRDIGFSESQRLLTVASRETRIKTFDIRTRLCSNMFTANDKPLWSCGVDRNEREHFLYAGDLRGGVYIFDMRFPETILSQFQSEENFSPVINIAAVPAGKVFSNGGFLVCQLTVVKFYEYASDTAVSTRLNVDGPFLSMQYDVLQDTVLFSARSNAQYPQSRFILTKLDKIDGIPVLQVKATIFGSAATPYMTRPTQLSVEDNTLVVGYLQDNKQLMMYDVRREERVQTMPVNEVVYDICPVNTSAGSYLAALTDNKCRIYKVNSSSRN